MTVDPPPSHDHDTRLVKRDPLLKVNDKTRADRTEKARKSDLEEGIETGKRESAENIKEQDALIKEQNLQVKRLTAEFALGAAHLLLAGQRSPLSATWISSLTANKQPNVRRERPARTASAASDWAISSGNGSCRDRH